MPKQSPKSDENPLAEVAKTIGTTLGSAANRASEMFREVMPATISEKLGVAPVVPKPAARAAKPKAKAKAKKKAAAKSKASSRKPRAKTKSARAGSR